MRYKTYKGKGIDIASSSNPGKHHKLSEQDIADIIYLYCEKGVKQKSIAEHYGVSVRTIQYILNPESREKNRQRTLQEDKLRHQKRMRDLRLRRKNDAKHSED